MNVEDDNLEKLNEIVRQTSQKRYSLVIPTELFNEVQTLADSQHMSVVEVLRYFIKMGLFIIKTPNCKVVVKEDSKEREITFI